MQGSADEVRENCDELRDPAVFHCDYAAPVRGLRRDGGGRPADPVRLSGRIAIDGRNTVFV
jgi:hypothetical protein